MAWIKYKNKREYLDFYGAALAARYEKQIRRIHADVLVPGAGSIRPESGPGALTRQRCWPSAWESAWGSRWNPACLSGIKKQSRRRSFCGGSSEKSVRGVPGRNDPRGDKNGAPGG